MAKQKQQRESVNGLISGAFYLGLLWGTSINRSEYKVDKCKVKACVFPKHLGDLCYIHANYYVYRYSMTGDFIDVADIWNEDNPAETYLSVVRFESDTDKLEKSLKIERVGYSNSRWKVTKENGILDVLYDNKPLVPNRQMGCDISRKGWGKKKIRKKQRQRPAGWHGHHPEQKPIKRWSRETIESIILPDGRLAECSTSPQ